MRTPATKARTPAARGVKANPFAWALRAMVIVALASYAAFIAGWLLGRQVVGDTWWPLAVLNSFPALAFMPLPAALIAALLLRSRVGWALAAVPLALWLGLFGWRFLPRAAGAEASGDTVRVMTFNLLSTNRQYDAIIGAIEEAQPDLIAFAELNPVTHDALVERLGEEYPYQAFYRLPGAGFGNGIYSRWPLDVLGPVHTGLGLRSVMADVYLPGGKARFVAAHPWATHVGRGWRGVKVGVERSFINREAQVAAICGYLDQWGDQPVILAGDFNMGEFSDAYRCISDRLQDSYKAVGRGHGNTWPSARPDAWPWRLFGWLPPLTRIDYIFHSDHWRATEARVLKAETGSDHRPVLAVLTPIE